jgi:acetyl esterase/lipase
MKSRLFLTLLCFSLAAPRLAAAPAGEKKQHGNSPPAGVTVLKDLVYKEPFKRPLLLDLYRPAKAEGRLPVVVWIHGGGWKNGSKDNCPAVWLAADGFAVASINYRLIHDAQWPAQINDCRDAVRWLRDHADKYRLDPAHIGAWGGSAGGHLVAILGTIDAPKGEATPSRIQAACDWYGPADLLTMPPNVVTATRTLEQVANSNGAKLLGATVRDIPETAKQASGLYHVSADDPPFLVMHGDEDPGVPIAQSEKFVAALRRAGVDTTWHIVKGAGHGGPLFRTEEVKSIVRNFFRRTLK